MENKQLEQEEVEKLKELSQKGKNLRDEIASIGIAQLNLDKRQENVENFFDQLRKEENAFFKQLEDKYGRGTIDPEAGTFTPYLEPTQEEISEE